MVIVLYKDGIANMSEYDIHELVNSINCEFREELHKYNTNQIKINELVDLMNNDDNTFVEMSSAEYKQLLFDDNLGCHLPLFFDVLGNLITVTNYSNYISPISI